MGVKLGDAIVYIKGDRTALQKDLGKAEGDTRSWANRLGGMVQGFGKAVMVGTGAAAAGAAVLGGELLKLAVDAAPLQGIKAAFEGITTSSGVSADAMIDALKRSSAEMVSQRDLMKSYNLAAQLVSKDFANTLPEAMQYLGKVSYATGEDMGYLMDSLVRGVGRLSPMILDNLAIQVDLNKAYDDWAKKNGVAVSAMTKTQKQAALMDQVMAKLRENTAALPDVAGSAAAGWGKFQAKLQDAKDTVGLAMLPALAALLNAVMPLIDMALPALASAITDYVVPAIELGAGLFSAFVENLQAGQDPVTALKGALSEFLPPGLVEQIMGFVATLQSLAAEIWPLLEPIIAWVAENVKLEDVLIALGIAVASVVIPALLGIVETVATVVAVGAALIGAVAAVRTAWESDFLGIRTMFEEAFAYITGLWTVHGEETIAQATGLWTQVQALFNGGVAFIQGLISTGTAKMQGWWSEHGASVMTIINALWAGLQSVIQAGTAAVQGLIQGVTQVVEAIWRDHGEALTTAAEIAWKAIQDAVDAAGEVLGSIIDAIALAIEGDWKGFGEKLRTAWDTAWEAIKSALRSAGEALLIIIASIVRDAIAKFTNTDWGAVGRGIAQGVAEGLRNGAQLIIDAAMAAAKAAWEAATGFFGIESPSTKGEWLGRMLDTGIARGVLKAASLPVRAIQSVANSMISQVYDHSIHVNLRHVRLPGVTDSKTFIEEMQGMMV